MTFRASNDNQSGRVRGRWRVPGWKLPGYNRAAQRNSGPARNTAKIPAARAQWPSRALPLTGGKPSEDQCTALLATIHQANQCCHWLSEQAWNTKKFRAYDLHHVAYRRARESSAWERRWSCAVSRDVVAGDERTPALRLEFRN